MAAEQDSSTGTDDSTPLASPTLYLGHRLRVLRRAKGLSVRELAALAQIDPDQIGRFERAESAHESATTIEACDLALGADGELIDLHKMIAESAASPPRGADDRPHVQHPAHSPVPIPRQLPATIRDFTGRAADLFALDTLLPTDADGTRTGQPGAVVISAIDGTAGIGKTTLAVYWGHRKRHRFPDGTLYANLRGYGPGSPATPSEVLDGFLRALGTPPGRIPGTEDGRAALFRSLLDGRRVLVVLDNASSSEQVRPLLPASPGCLALITSRSSMTGLVVSQGAARISLDLLPFDEALVLLRGIVGDARADAEPQALTDIVRACARLPLALRIAGARAASRPHLRLGDLRVELLDGQTLLDALSLAGDEATAVRAVFAWSYRALPAAQAVVFRRLGLHPGVEIDLYATAALADATPDQVRRDLEVLANVHLIEPVAPHRYLAHDLLRAYALERTSQEDTPKQRSDALNRLLGFYLHTADAADRTVMLRIRASTDAAPAPLHAPVFASLRQAMTWFEVEYANLTAAARRAGEIGLHAVAWQLPAALNGLFDMCGRRADWIAALEDGLIAARALGDRRGERYTLESLATTLADHQRPAEAVDFGRQAVAIARQEPDRIGEALALAHLGWAYLGAKRHGDAALCFRQSSEICQTMDSAWHEAIAISGLGRAYLGLGRFEEALDCQQRALNAFRQADDRGREGFTLRLLGEVHLAANRLDLALACHTHALQIASRVGNRSHQAAALECLGTDLHHAGDSAGARDRWQRALEIFEQLGDLHADEIRARLLT
jgi:tetratricopeptide (TPR) repeat protein/transcriptional regulator with XRE-family HTH domain